MPRNKKTQTKTSYSPTDRPRERTIAELLAGPVARHVRAIPTDDGVIDYSATAREYIRNKQAEYKTKYNAESRPYVDWSFQVLRLGQQDVPAKYAFHIKLKWGDQDPGSFFTKTDEQLGELHDIAEQTGKPSVLYWFATATKEIDKDDGPLPRRYNLDADVGAKMRRIVSYVCLGHAITDGDYPRWLAFTAIEFISGPLYRDTDTCAVCMEPAKGTLSVLRCCHMFHPHCIDEWLVGAQRCPVCRTRSTYTQALVLD